MSFYVCSTSAKRLLDTELADEGARNSTTSTKKVQRYNFVCTYCPKPFTRQCDQNKHEKTHTRPHKCPREDCKYSKRGFPNEAEKNRHVNDIHEKSANLYRCPIENCAHESKRLSNLKQHMESRHGLVYIRTKGKRSAGLELSASQSSQIPTIPEPADQVPDQQPSGPETLPSSGNLTFSSSTPESLESQTPGMAQSGPVPAYKVEPPVAPSSEGLDIFPDLSNILGQYSNGAGFVYMAGQQWTEEPFVDPTSGGYFETAMSDITEANDEFAAAEATLNMPL